MLGCVLEGGSEGLPLAELIEKKGAQNWEVRGAPHVLSKTGKEAVVGTVMSSVPQATRAVCSGLWGGNGSSSVLLCPHPA